MITGLCHYVKADVEKKRETLRLRPRKIQKIDYFVISFFAALLQPCAENRIL